MQPIAGLNICLESKKSEFKMATNLDLQKAFHALSRNFLRDLVRVGVQYVLSQFDKIFDVLLG